MQPKTFFLACSLFSASSGICRAAPVRKIVPKGAVSFTSKAQGFAVWFPGKPKQGTSASMDGRPITEYYGLKWPKSRRSVNPDAVRFVVFTTSYRDNAPFSRPAARDHLEGLTESYLLTHKVGTRFTGDITEQAGFPGRDLRFLSKLHGQSERMRLFENAKWTYTLSVYGSAAAMKKQSGVVNRFFDSFRILPQ